MERFVSIGIDSSDPVKTAWWWSDALGWPIVSSFDGEVEIAPIGGERGPALIFVAVPEPKTVKNRIHLDLVSDDADHQQQTVERLIAEGATRIDVGQGTAPWVVLADPDGNELCVLEPRDRYRGKERLAAVVVDSHDPPALARFWAGATDWVIGSENPGGTSLYHPTGTPPDLDFVLVDDPKVVKNRVRLDVLAPDDDLQVEAARLVALGAAPVDIGQGAVPWIVLADPEGNEFCVLPPDDI